MIASVHCMEVTNICDTCTFHTSSTKIQQQKLDTNMCIYIHTRAAYDISLSLNLEVCGL